MTIRRSFGGLVVLGHVVYLSHGGSKYYSQTRFSVLTLLDLLIKENRSDIKIVIFTDRISESPVHPLVSSVYISPRDLVRFRGPLEYVHRIKLEVLRRAENEIGTPFIYVDCDTRWLAIPERQFEVLERETGSGGLRQMAYMHKLEGEISATFFSAYWRILNKQRDKLAEWGLSKEGPWYMWNSGTFGVPISDNGLFDRALEITDHLLPLPRNTRNCVEQLALSLVACADYQVAPFDDCLTHYWAYGSELPVILDQFFDKLEPGLPVAEQARLAAQFQINEQDLKRIQGALQNRLLRFWKKLVISSHKRKIDLLAYLLRRGASKPR